MATAVLRGGMPATTDDRLKAAHEGSAGMAGTDDIGDRVLTSTDPLADARAWLAAMRSSMQRVRQQAAPMSLSAEFRSDQPSLQD